MRKLLKYQAPRKGSVGIPPEGRRLEIIQALLKLKHFDGLWYNDRTLAVRKFATGTPQYLSWKEAIGIVEAAGPERKTVKAETLLIVASKAAKK